MRRKRKLNYGFHWPVYERGFYRGLFYKELKGVLFFGESGRYFFAQFGQERGIWYRLKMMWKQIPKARLKLGQAQLWEKGRGDI